MPDPPDSKVHVHPYLRASHETTTSPHKQSPYVELAVTSNFSFLQGASHPDELVDQSARIGYDAIALTDTNSIAGMVRAHVAAKETGVQLIVGCRLRFADHDWLSILVYPTNRDAYARLCRLLTLGKRRASKGKCLLTVDDLLEHHDGLLAVVLCHEIPGDAVQWLRKLRKVFDDDRLSVALVRFYGPQDTQHATEIVRLSKDAEVPLVAVNDVHYHHPERQALQDVVTCVRHGCTITEAGFRLFPNGERYLKPPDEMIRLFTEYPDAIARTQTIAERAAGFSLDQLRYEYPDEHRPKGVTPMAYLRKLTWKGAHDRFPCGVPDKVTRQIEHEFSLIEELQYAPYFLTVHDIVSFARSRNILCQGRGAAANSAVCYCLGVTSVDPDRINVLFERFVSRERDEPPDIDIDFEHERREEVLQYIYEKYGRDRAALTAVVITYRGRSAVRDVGKVLGLSEDAVDRLAKRLSHWIRDFNGEGSRTLELLGFNPHDRTIRLLVKRVQELIGFPRHLSQHPGGFVITQSPLHDFVPIENAAMPDRTVIEWDKDDIDALGMLKVDILGLGMLTCIRKGFELLKKHHSQVVTLATLPPEDTGVYDMLCRADTLGVFQVESRAQMTMLPRLKPRNYYDLVIEVAIVRPGPIIGKMVHPYLRRRDRKEEPYYPDDKIRDVLQRTLGVPIFQEQAMALAIVAAGFTPGEAEQLRRAITAWTSKDRIARYTTRFIEGMLANGYSKEFADWCFQRLKGFSEYGFPESHAASFALLVYASAWLKYRYPAAFAAALLNSQPMGFYGVAQIVRDARDHGVRVRAVDTNLSEWDCTLEDGGEVLRLGMRMVKGLGKSDGCAIADATKRRAGFSSVFALWRASGARVASFRALAQADAFGSMGVDRQHALWEVRRLRDDDLPLLDSRPESIGPSIELPSASRSDDALKDYTATGLSLKAHPLSFLRERLVHCGVLTAAEVKDQRRTPYGRFVAVAGVVLFRQRPGTAKGIMFMTLEDETARIDLIVRPQVYQQYREAAIHARAVIVRGKVERQGIVVHVLARKFKNIESWMAQLPYLSRDFR